MTPIEILKSKIKTRLSEKRFLHTVSVAECALKLADFCKKESKHEAEIASLLHDITKEYALEEQLEILSSNKIEVDNEDVASVGILHSFTAPYVVKREFSKFATPDVLSSIQNHTLGDASMSVFDKIIFLADFIEDSRTYPESISTARYVREAMKAGSFEHNLQILDNACLMEFESTVAHLNSLGKQVNRRTLLAMNSIISKN